MIRTQVLHSGSVTAPAIRLDAPLSFWGGFDPASGRIIDQAHPQVGASLDGNVVILPGSRGSSGTPGVLAESLRLGTGPAGLIVEKADVNLVAGAIVAAALYGIRCPIVLIDRSLFVDIGDWIEISMTSEGDISPGAGFENQV